MKVLVATSYLQCSLTTPISNNLVVSRLSFSGRLCCEYKSCILLSTDVSVDQGLQGYTSYQCIHKNNFFEIIIFHLQTEKKTS